MRKVHVCLILPLLIISVVAITKEEARTRLDKLLEEATLHGQRGLSWLNTQLQNLRTKSVTVVQEGANRLRAESMRFQNELLSIQNSASGKNITSCTKGKESLLRELSTIANLEMNSCVDRFTQQGSVAINRALANFNRILESVETLAAALEICADQACIDTEVANIEFEEMDVPRRYQEEIDFANNRAEAALLLITECGSRQAEKLVSQGSDIIQEVHQCVDKIING